MEYLEAATALSMIAVAIVTQLLKYIPVEWTTRFAVWINIGLSVIATVIAFGSVPSFTGDWGTFLGQLLTIVIGAALTYHLVIKAIVTKPQGNLPADKAV